MTLLGGTTRLGNLGKYPPPPEVTHPSRGVGTLPNYIYRNSENGIWAHSQEKILATPLPQKKKKKKKKKTMLDFCVSCESVVHFSFSVGDERRKLYTQTQESLISRVLMPGTILWQSVHLLKTLTHVMKQSKRCSSNKVNTFTPKI